MKIEAFFFDFDGVLVDTETVWMNCVYNCCQDSKIPVDREKLVTFAGDGDVMMMKYVLECGNIALEEIMADVRRRFGKLAKELSLRPGVEGYLRYAKRMGIKLALVSNSGRLYIDEWLKRLALDKIFDCIVTRSDGVPLKPAPDPYFKALEQMKVKPERVVVFEDSMLGMEAAVSAGLYAVAYPNTITEKAIMASSFPHADLGVIGPEEMLSELQALL